LRLEGVGGVLWLCGVGGFCWVFWGGGGVVLLLVVGGVGCGLWLGVYKLNQEPPSLNPQVIAERQRITA